jgi:hypothetical protein
MLSMAESRSRHPIQSDNGEEVVVARYIYCQKTMQFACGGKHRRDCAHTHAKHTLTSHASVELATVS